MTVVLKYIFLNINNIFLVIIIFLNKRNNLSTYIPFFTNTNILILQIYFLD